MKNKSIFFLGVLAIVSFGFGKPKKIKSSQVNVVIDAGHGGSDNGANVDGVTEKKIVEELIYKILDEQAVIAGSQTSGAPKPKQNNKVFNNFLFSRPVPHIGF